MKRIATAVLITGLLQPALADGYHIGLGYASVRDKAGLEMDFGLVKQFEHLSVNLLPLSVIFVRNYRYWETTNGVGMSRCQDSHGNQVDSSNCGTQSYEYAASLSLEYPLSKQVSIGTGARISSDVDPFAVIRFHQERSSILLKGGPNYISASVTAEF